MKKAFITTLGCKVNQFESAAIQNSFEREGYHAASSLEEADIIVINTCAVTSRASAQSRQNIRKAARRNREALIVVTGCHAQMAADQIREIEEIPEHRLRIIGNDQKHKVVTHTQNPEESVASAVNQLHRKSPPICDLAVDIFPGRTRAFLRVQDGCNSFCSYCIVPHTRGQSRSLSVSAVLDQVERYQNGGHREIVVTGIHVGQYGYDLKEASSISSLMKRLCKTFPDLRFRLSSIEPVEIDDDLLAAIADFDNFMPHLHIPLQSGDNEILSLMNRRYTGEAFIEKIQTCRRVLPDAALGIDVLVGFPGETDKHFRNTLAVLNEADFTYLHVFPYSKRPGTPAASFPHQNSKQLKSERVERVRILSEKKRIAFYTRFIGTKRAALIENERDESGLLKGFTDNYIPVFIDGDDRLKNTVVTVELSSINENGVAAEVPE